MEQYQQFKKYQGPAWLIIVAMFFLFSALTGMWYISWIVFILGAAAMQIIKAVLLQEGEKDQPGMYLEQRRSAWNSAMWLIITSLYFILSFATGAWYITWIIFIIGAAITPIVRVNIK